MYWMVTLDTPDTVALTLVSVNPVVATLPVDPVAVTLYLETK
jgi:hypothetical protein